MSDADGFKDEIAPPQEQSQSAGFEILYFEPNRPLYKELGRLRDEYRSDCIVTLATLSDVAMRVPMIKHKWVARLCRYQNDLKDAGKMLKKEIDKVSDEIRNAAPVKLPQTAIDKEATSGKYPKIAVLKERCELIERLVSQCDDIVNKHVRYLNDEIRTIVEIQKMETL